MTTTCSGTPLIVHVPPRPPILTLFPYTTLFRSDLVRQRRILESAAVRGADERRNRSDDRPVFRQPRVSGRSRSEEHTSELQSRVELVCRLLLEKKKQCVLGKLPGVVYSHDILPQ